MTAATGIQVGTDRLRIMSRRDTSVVGGMRRSLAFTTIARIVLLTVFLGLWELASRSGWVNEVLFGRPSGIAVALWDYLPSMRAVHSFESTGKGVLLAFLIGSTAGVVIGLALGINRTLDDVIGPFLPPLNSIPRIALAPLFIAWFGLTLTGKVALGISVVIFILIENARSAVRSVDSELVTMARVAGLRRVSLLWKVVLPSAVPTIFAGLRLAFTYAMLGVIASEMIAAENGIGQDLIYYSSIYEINHFFAILLALMLAAVMVAKVFDTCERRLLRWQRQ